MEAQWGGGKGRFGSVGPPPKSGCNFTNNARMLVRDSRSPADFVPDHSLLLPLLRSCRCRSPSSFLSNCSTFQYLSLQQLDTLFPTISLGLAVPGFTLRLRPPLLFFDHEHGPRVYTIHGGSVKLLVFGHGKHLRHICSHNLLIASSSPCKMPLSYWYAPNLTPSKRDCAGTDCLHRLCTIRVSCHSLTATDISPRPQYF